MVVMMMMMTRKARRRRHGGPFAGVVEARWRRAAMGS